MATRKTENTPVNWQEQLEEESANIAKRIAAPSGDRIRINNNTSFTTPDGMEGEELEVIVLDFVSANFYYDRPYDRDVVFPPACFAISENPSDLMPSTNSPDTQAESCSVCPANQYGSAATGKGKACKNVRLVAVTPVPTDNEDYPIWILSLPPTSIKPFDTFVSSLASRHNTIPVGVVSKLTLDRAQTYSAPRFSLERPITDEEASVVMPMRTDAKMRIITEPDVSEYEAPKQRVRR